MIALDDLTAVSDAPSPPIDAVTDPLTMVIFGGTGDLARRKLLPALFRLCLDGRLPSSFSVVGVARRDQSDPEYRQAVREAIASNGPPAAHQEAVEAFAANVHFHQAQFQDPEAYVDLKRALDQLREERALSGNVLFYLATPPEFDAAIVRNLSQAGLITPHANESPWTRVIFEKPFGHDLASAQALNQDIHQHVRERQVYRIDHYLGKETVQNIMAVRFANGVLEPLWNRNYVDSIQITAAESLGIETRSAYYETAGALRDMIQSHLLQVMSLVAMEPPVSWSAKAIHDEKVKVLQATNRMEGDAVDICSVRGQYGPGMIDGEPVPGYRQEPGVAPDSNTETFAAVKLSIDSWRWAGVPIYLRTGKRLPTRMTEVVLTFKNTPQMLFQRASGAVRQDVLIMRIQPDEGVTLTLNAKIPGQGFHIHPVHLDFFYDSTFSEVVPEAYERLLLDAMRGDSTLFTRTDEVEEGWSIIQGILDKWAITPATFPNYAAGDWGPECADDILHAPDHSWRNP